MNRKAASLDEIQRWMQSVIMHPGGVREGVDSPAARQHLEVAFDDLESVICRSQALASDERLEIYVNAYYERLLECLREEFAATRYATGNELFDALAFGYLQHSPSRSYTLNLLGDGFPRFLAGSRLHAHDVPQGAAAGWPEFISELAAFERLQRDVFDAPGSEGRPTLCAEQLARVPPDRWAQLRLVPAPCLRLGRFDHPVHAYWSAWKDEAAPIVPGPRRTWLAINRRDYAVERHELSGTQFALLAALVAGEPLSQAIVAAASAWGESAVAALEQELGGWFADWTRADFFLEFSGSEPPD